MSEQPASSVPPGSAGSAATAASSLNAPPSPRRVSSSSSSTSSRHSTTQPTAAAAASSIPFNPSPAPGLSAFTSYSSQPPSVLRQAGGSVISPSSASSITSPASLRRDDTTSAEVSAAISALAGDEYVQAKAPDADRSSRQPLAAVLNEQSDEDEDEDEEQDDWREQERRPGSHIAARPRTPSPPSSSARPAFSPPSPLTSPPAVHHIIDITPASPAASAAAGSAPFSSLPPVPSHGELPMEHQRPSVTARHRLSVSQAGRDASSGSISRQSQEEEEEVRWLTHSNFFLATGEEEKEEKAAEQREERKGGQQDDDDDDNDGDAEERLGREERLLDERDRHTQQADEEKQQREKQQTRRQQPHSQPQRERTSALAAPEPIISSFKGGSVGLLRPQPSQHISLSYDPYGQRSSSPSIAASPSPSSHPSRLHSSASTGSSSISPAAPASAPPAAAAAPAAVNDSVVYAGVVGRTERQLEQEEARRRRRVLRRIGFALEENDDDDEEEILSLSRAAKGKREEKEEKEEMRDKQGRLLHPVRPLVLTAKQREKERREKEKRRQREERERTLERERRWLSPAIQDKIGAFPRGLLHAAVSCLLSSPPSPAVANISSPCMLPSAQHVLLDIAHLPQHLSLPSSPLPGELAVALSRLLGLESASLVCHRGMEARELWHEGREQEQEEEKYPFASQARSASALSSSSSATVYNGPLLAPVCVLHNLHLAPAAVQSVLVQAMRLKQVTVDGILVNLPRTHLVVATHHSGSGASSPLPRQALEPFLYDVMADSGFHSLLRSFLFASSLPSFTPVDWQSLLPSLLSVTCSHLIHQYILDLVVTLRQHARLALGPSPSTQHSLTCASAAAAMMGGVGYVRPVDVDSVAETVLAHRVVLRQQAGAAGRGGGAAGGGAAARAIVHHLITKAILPPK